MTYPDKATGKQIGQEGTDERILGGPEFVCRAARRGSRDDDRWQQLLESCKAIKVATSRRTQRPVGNTCVRAVIESGLLEELIYQFCDLLRRVLMAVMANAL